MHERSRARERERNISGTKVCAPYPSTLQGWIRNHAPAKTNISTSAHVSDVALDGFRTIGTISYPS